MGGPTYVCIMPDLTRQCLHLLPPSEMDRYFSPMMQSRELFDEELDDALRVIGEHVEQVKLDVQGRIRVSDHLLEHAGIEDKIVMIGTQSRAQLWSLKLRPEMAKVDLPSLAAAYQKFRSRSLPHNQ